MKKKCIYNLFLLLINFNILSATTGISVTTLDNPAPGYLRFDVGQKTNFEVFDNYGEFKIIKQSNSVMNFYKLLKNGLIAQLGSNKYYLYNKDFEFLDSLINPTSYQIDYHDLISLSNGHYLLLCTQRTQVDMSKIIESGESNASLISNVLIETDLKGTVYWTWKLFDHINIKDVTDDIDLTLKVIDLTHVNSMDEDSEGNILISARHLDELLLINKSTGEFIWRMGGSKSKNNQFNFINDNLNGFTGFSHQHSAGFLQNGNILLYDNGNLKNPQYSRAVEYSINNTDKTATKVWEYINSPSIYTSSMGSAYRLPNGNTLINWSVKLISEVRPDKTKALEISLASTFKIFRVQKIFSNLPTLSKYISSVGDYSFNNDSNITGISFNLTKLAGNSTINLQKHFYSPSNFELEGQFNYNILPYRWVFTPDNNNISHIEGSIKIDSRTIPEFNKNKKYIIYKREKETEGLFKPLFTVFNKISEELTADFSGFGEFILADVTLDTPIPVFPENHSLALTTDIIKWKKTKNADKYLLQLSLNPNFSQNIAYGEIINDSIFQYSNLKNNSSYYFHLKAINNLDTSVWSETFEFKTIIAVPKQEYPLDESIGFKFADSLKWSKIDGATEYSIQIDTNSFFEKPIINIVTKQNIFTDFTGLNHFMKYYWRVRALNVKDTTKWSSGFCFTTQIKTPDLVNPVNNSSNIPVSNTFSWSNVLGADYYYLQISKDILFNNIEFSVHQISDNKILFENLSPEAKYFWRVKAINVSDSSEWSSIFSFETIINKPILIKPANGSIDLDVDLRLKWDKRDIQLNYRFQLSKDEKFSKIFFDTSSILTNYYDFKELEPNNKFYWRVKAFVDSAESDWSDIFFFNTGKGFILNAPKLYLPENNSELADNHLLEWNKENHARVYNLQISKSNDFQNLEKKLTNLSQSFFEISDLENNSEFYWRVKSFSLYDSSNWSEVWKFRTGNATDKIILLEPGNDAMQVPVLGKFEWKNIEGVEYFTLQVSTKPDFINLIYDEKITGSNIFTFSNLNKNETYFWRIRYFKKNEISEWSDLFQFSTESDEKLESPQIIFPDNNEIPIPVNTNIKWNKVTNASKYHIAYSSYIDFRNYKKYSGLENNDFTIDNLDFDAIYYVRVTASNNSAASNWSEVKKIWTQLEPPIIVSPINFTILNQGVIKIIWSVSLNKNKYHIQIASDSNFSNIIEEKNNLEDLYYNWEFSDDSTYYCRVKSYNDSNFSLWSNFVNFKHNGTSDIINDNIKNDLILYPNPVTNEVNLFIEDILSNNEFVIFDSNGKNILTGKIRMGLNMLNINCLSPGVYFLKYCNKSKILIKN